ncbi:MAG: DegT/DnrJ/EryC1/StrS family aminotransferase [Odoribacter splanchnicus]
MKLQMVDLKGQYDKIREEVNAEIQKVLDTTAFINGPKVKEFASHLAEYSRVKHVIPCGNGTDALQIALMALELQPGDEVIVPAFTYVATAEVIGLLGYTPVMVDVDYASFNITVKNIERALTAKTKAIVPVHLFGQSCDMEPILKFASEHHLYVVEDNAQAIGAEYTFSDGTKKRTGTMGTIGCTSFFPSKNLGGYGDGGALMTDDDELAEKIRMIANHGQKVKYHHAVLGCNSRLDTLQAAILDVKLKHLDEYGAARYEAAQYYTRRLSDIEGIITPAEMPYSTHVYHQYTLKVLNGRRDALKKFLEEGGIPAMIYYPLPLQQQEAFKPITRAAESLDTAEQLAGSVLSLPIHTEMTPVQQDLVIERIKEFYKS